MACGDTKHCRRSSHVRIGPDGHRMCLCGSNGSFNAFRYPSKPRPRGLNSPVTRRALSLTEFSVPLRLKPHARFLLRDRIAHERTRDGYWLHLVGARQRGVATTGTYSARPVFRTASFSRHADALGPKTPLLASLEQDSTTSITGTRLWNVMRASLIRLLMPFRPAAPQPPKSCDAPARTG